MKLLIDHNLSFKLPKHLSAIFPGSIRVSAAGLNTATDLQVWEYAKENDFVLVTQDADFIDWNRLFGIPPKILWIRFGNQSVDFLSKDFCSMKMRLSLLRKMRRSRF
jgi:predicted nuclease of predicted toxin-antitoxin system